MPQPITKVSYIPERRRRPRLRLACPVRLHRTGETSWIETKTEDISCEGFYCVTGQVFSIPETLECELVIPSGELGTQDHEMVLRCRAEVVRIEPQADNKAYGIACRLMDYNLDVQMYRQD